MADKLAEHAVVIDVGKTHVKLHVLNSEFNSVFSKQTQNVIETKGKYPCFNTQLIWQWLIKGIKEVTENYCISAITVTTHGATAALIDRNANTDDGLVLPIMEYEYHSVKSDDPAYDKLRPDFRDSYSPDLPAGLNLGRQLYWLKNAFPEQFAQVTDILMYPQYWAWRFTGKRYSEITSLGCHSDLWSFQKWDYSSLVDSLGCRDLLPPVQPAWFNCGEILPELRRELGLDPECRFFNGIHDSNASFLRYRLTQREDPFTVISTGTWTILMAAQTPLENLKANKDMLANIDVTGRPIACARFMGGREFDAICEQAGSSLGEQFDVQDLQDIIDQGVFALPDFSNGSGPFGGNTAGFVGDINSISGIALATIYCALMIDHQLEMLGAQGRIFIEGAFLKNPLLCATINQLRDNQEVLLSRDTTGTVQGAGHLTNWGQAKCSIELQDASNISLRGLSRYQKLWLKHISQN